MSSFMEDLVVPPPPFEKRSEEKPQVEIDGATGKVRLTPGVASATSGTLLRAKLELEAFQRAFQRVEGVFIHRCECLRCGYVWETLSQTPPSSCPTCHISWWFRPKDWKKMREGAESLRLKANGSGQVSVIRPPGRPPGSKNKRYKLGKKKKHAGSNLAAGEAPHAVATEDAHVPQKALETVGPAGRSQAVAGEILHGPEGTGEKDLMHAAHGDYGALISSVLGLSDNQLLGSRQSPDDGARQNPADPASLEGAVDISQIPIEDQVAHRVDPSSVPRFLNAPAPAVQEPTAQESKLKPEDLAIRRVTWEELHPHEAANQRAIAEAQAAVSTVPSIRPTPAETKPVPETVALPDGVDPGLARWADSPVELPPAHLDDED